VGEPEREYHVVGLWPHDHLANTGRRLQYGLRFEF
jgi:hypothetical protein